MFKAIGLVDSSQLNFKGFEGPESPATLLKACKLRDWPLLGRLAYDKGRGIKAVAAIEVVLKRPVLAVGVFLSKSRLSKVLSNSRISFLSCFSSVVDFLLLILMAAFAWPFLIGLKLSSDSSSEVSSI